MHLDNRDDDRCFQHTTKLALNHKEIEKNSGRIRKLGLLQTNIVGK